MTDIQLHELDVTNFRSIKGHVHAPLDAKVVLVHGENGAGKTSLLAAIEIALTGLVVSLRHADPNYRAQLLHRETNEGRIDLKTVGLAGANHFSTLLSKQGPRQDGKLPGALSSFFSERCYLPQSLLGQLLQLYQESESGPNSPLSRFVNELLGLDRLDAIETGLAPVSDLRNLRKTTDRYGQVEYEKDQLDRTLKEYRDNRTGVARAIVGALADLNGILTQLGLQNRIDEARLDSVEDLLSDEQDALALERLEDQRQQLASIRREADRGDTAISQTDEATLARAHREATEALERWRQQFDDVFAQLRDRAAKLLPDVVLAPGDPEALVRDALVRLRAAKERVVARAARAAQDAKRQTAVTAELIVARQNLGTIDEEIGKIAANAGNLAGILAQISSFITDDTCPVCDRDFKEKKSGSLADHVSHKVRVLSGSAERLLGLSKNRGDQQVLIERLDGEAAELKARQLDPKTIAALEREAAELDGLVGELDRYADAAREGTRLAAAETGARRALSGYQGRSLARTATMATLAELTQRFGQGVPEATATPQETVTKLLTTFSQQAEVLNARIGARRNASEILRRIRADIGRRQSLDAQIEEEMVAYRRIEAALSRAKVIRTDAQTIMTKVEAVRSSIISREFNDRLNRLWRDLFVRLAPHEPYVPAFKIPSDSTQRLEPKLITTHRSGGAGGTPGAMLSAGNLNTAALTLFIALHLTVSPQLPWLILDDPVQSMDDIHIAHFAALLRTLSKGQKRQVIVAVHDRQLFEYLRLELSPAFAGDSLLSLELFRGPKQDTQCVPDRRSYQEETALRFVA